MEKWNEMLVRFLGEGARRRQMMILIALGALGLFLLTLGSMGSAGRQPAAFTDMPDGSEKKQVAAVDSGQTRAEEEYLAGRLEAVLSQMAGVGAVHVTVKLDGSSVVKYAANGSENRRVTDEADQGGGKRVTTEDNIDDQVVVVQTGAGQQQQAVIEREIAPRVTGVLVVAEGARNPRVRMDLFQATQVALGVEPHLVEVLPRRL